MCSTWNSVLIAVKFVNNTLLRSISSFMTLNYARLFANLASFNNVCSFSYCNAASSSEISCSICFFSSCLRSSRTRFSCWDSFKNLRFMFSFGWVGG